MKHKIEKTKDLSANTEFYYKTFSEWILDYIKRICAQLKSLKEIRGVKGLLEIRDFTE
jgi:hypothetical protein